MARKPEDLHTDFIKVLQNWPVILINVKLLFLYAFI